MVALLFIITSLSSMFFSSYGGQGCGTSSRAKMPPWVLIKRDEGTPDCLGSAFERVGKLLRTLIPAGCATGIDRKVGQFLKDEEEVELTMSRRPIPFNDFAIVTYIIPNNIRSQPARLPDEESESERHWRKGHTFYYDVNTSKWTTIDALVIGSDYCYERTRVSTAKYFCVLVPASIPLLAGTPYFTCETDSNTLWGIDAGMQSFPYGDHGELHVFYRLLHYGLQTAESSTSK